ncbi:DegT/DnrJ/EryC1/StrS family aminotransferase [bacterium]|nr:DegT/DnrJ/EryC1/StrS family aminotransferase [bacterium]
MPTRQTAEKKGINFLDLPAQHKALKKPLLQAMGRVLENSKFILGPEVEALESEVAGFCGARYGIGVNSGTDALVLALKAMDIGAGDEVIIPDFSFIATATAVLLAGATPVLADIEPDTFNLDPKQVSRLITKKTRAIIPVHLYGQSADMTALLKLARQAKVAVIEDAAQAIGARWRGRPVGALGDMGCLSFFPTKNLGALGDAGMVLTNNARLAARLRRLRQHGADKKYYHTELGFNSRLDEIQAAALRIKLNYLSAWNERRQSLALAYDRGLRETGVAVPSVRPGAEHVYHQYVLQTPRREALRDYLAKQGISTSIHYSIPLHRQPVLARFPSARRKFPVSEQAAGQVLCLPIAPEISDAQIRTVITGIRRFVGKHGE